MLFEEEQKLQTKYGKYEQLSADTLCSLTENRENWQKFLDTASRMYKYSFDDQVLIHAQRPDTIACADFSFWTAQNKMDRHIKQYANGIALLDRDKRKLHYVYAVEDTEPRTNGNSKDPEAYIWKLAPEKRATINDMLCKQGRISSDTLEKTIVSMTYTMAQRKATEYFAEFDTIYDRLSQTVPKEQLKTSFMALIAESAAYMAAKRTGTDVSQYLPKNPFANLSLFGNAEMAALVGEATADTAEVVIRQIERNVNDLVRLERSAEYGKYQRENQRKRSSTEAQDSERDSLHTGRENTDISSVPRRERGGSDSDRSLRKNEGTVPQGEFQSDIQQTSASEPTDTTSASDRRTGMGNGTEDSQTNGRSGRNGRGTENDKSAEMGRSDEQLQDVGAGNYNQRTDRDRYSGSLTVTEAEVNDTSAFSFATNFNEAIHNAFDELEMNHSFSDKQKKFLERLEKFAIKNTVTENLVDTAFSMLPAYRNTYGNREYLSKNTFSRRLGAIERELEEAIQRNLSSISEKKVTGLDKAKRLINDFCESEYGSEANFDDMHNIGIAYTTLTDDELPIQVTADLIDYKITYEFDGEVYNVEQYDSIEDMAENGLTGLNFNDLIFVPDKVLERHEQTSASISDERDRTEIDEDTAYGMWEDDFPVYADGEKLAVQPTNYDELIKAAEIFRESHSFSVASEDLTQYERLSDICNRLDTLSETVDDEVINIADYAFDEDIGAPFAWNTSQNVYRNVEVAILDGNTEFIEIYMSDLVHDIPFFDTDDTAKLRADLKAYIDDYILPEKQMKNKDIPQKELQPVTIEKYGVTLNFSEIKSVELVSRNEEYIGGIDSEGHENKGNYAEYKGTISFYDYGDSSTVMRSDTTNIYYGGSFPVTLEEVVAEIEEYLDKAANDTDISVYIENKDGSRTYLNATAQNEETKFFVYEVFNDGKEIERFSSNDKFECEVYLDHHKYDNSIIRSGSSLVIKNLNGDVINDEVSSVNEKDEVIMDKEKLKKQMIDLGSEVLSDLQIDLNKEMSKPVEERDESYIAELEEMIAQTEEEFIDERKKRFLDNIMKMPDVNADNSSKSTTTVKGADLNIGDKVMWEGNPYEIESKGGLLGMKPLFETAATIVSPSLIWREKEFEVYEFAEQRQAFEDYFTEQEMLDIVSKYQFIGTSKQSVVDYFHENSDSVNRADYLRSIYNDDYSEFNISDGRYGYKAQNEGLLIWKGNFLSSDEKQTISWNRVQELVGKLIDNDEFLDINDIIDTDDNSEQLSLFSDDYIMLEDTEPTAQNEVATEAEKTAPAAEKPVGAKKDFTITNENLGEGGAKTKYRANVAAIRTLKEIEAENRLATSEEQQILSQYVGWGGLKNAFEDFHDDWKNEYNELKELLTPEEYAAASASVLNAHYTSPTVISAMYEALKSNGFIGGKILEPAMGIGNFFGKIPADVRDNSKLYGVELDSISGRIAQQLYPNANIKISGFEKLDIKDNTFDLAIGNVPFGGYSLNEAAYNKYHFLIHDHFFAKSLDKVKPNGIVAFITSKGTLDKANPAVRRYIAERADLVGAIRLPNTAFKANAGTEVTSDIIFLQKREKPIELTHDTTPSWVDLGRTENGLAINQYFIDNPDMVLGKIVEGNKLYGRGSDDTMCIPIEGADLSEQLDKAIKKIHFSVSSVVDETSAEVFDDTVEIPLNVKNFSYALISDNIYYRNNSDMLPFEGKKTDIPRIKGMIEIRDNLRALINCQIDNGSDEQLKALQEKLNILYDKFVEKHGRLNSKQNLNAFKEDSSAPLLSSLEHFKGEEFIGKAAIFEKRTILPKTDITSVETSSEALTLSLAKKTCVDMAYMQELTGFSKEKILDDLKNIVYENPMKTDEAGNPHLESADEYLSGNIRKKLEYMKENFGDDSRYAHNIEALENAMPIPLQAADIDIKLGAPCVSPKLVQDFMYETLGTPMSMQNHSWNEKTAIKISYSDITSRWSIENKRSDKENTAANAKFGTKRRSAYELLEDCLNLQATVVRDAVEVNNKVTSVVNQSETEFAQEKQRQLQEAFKNWIYADPVRREEVVDTYNRMFNSTRPREYDGSALEFTGMNSEITLRKHQKDAVARALYGGNTLFAHEVGAGKTYEMIAAAMEGKRLGLHNKALICVPNHLTEQEGADFIKLYPNANILVATADDFTKKNRRKLFAKIATGDYDAVIIGHSQLVNLPISQERQERLLESQISEIINGVAALKEQKGDNFQIKQMEKTRKSLEAKLDKLVNAPKRDDVVNFEELGIDKLIIDEAHMFKNLFISTKMSNISGISTNDNIQKTMDLYLKTQYLDEITGGKGTIFATGTPYATP